MHDTTFTTWFMYEHLCADNQKHNVPVVYPPVVYPESSGPESSPAAVELLVFRLRPRCGPGCQSSSLSLPTWCSSLGAQSDDSEDITAYPIPVIIKQLFKISYRCKTRIHFQTI